MLYPISDEAKMSHGSVGKAANVIWDKKNWEKWAVPPTWARERPQSWIIGTFWKALDIYALYFMAIFIGLAFGHVRRAEIS